MERDEFMIVYIVAARVRHREMRTGKYKHNIKEDVMYSEMSLRLAIPREWDCEEGYGQE